LECTLRDLSNNNKNTKTKFVKASNKVHKVGTTKLEKLDQI